MATVAETLELAIRVEQASGPDRYLDGAIRKALFGDFGFCGDEGWLCSACSLPAHELTQTPECGAPMGLADERQSKPSNWQEDERLPAYTASLDAAMTLVPEGSTFYVDSGTNELSGGCHACVWSLVNRRLTGGSLGVAAPALALTVACLRAAAAKAREL